MQFTVFFDPPFWVGVLEDERDGCLYAARHVFGAEPSAQQVYEFVLAELPALCARMTTGVPVEEIAGRRVNPKRAQRAARRELAAEGIGSKAREALRAQVEQNKQERQVVSREEREAAREHKRQVRREKARKKHRGR